MIAPSSARAVAPAPDLYPLDTELHALTCITALLLQLTDPMIDRTQAAEARDWLIGQASDRALAARAAFEALYFGEGGR